MQPKFPNIFFFNLIRAMPPLFFFFFFFSVPLPCIFLLGRSAGNYLFSSIFSFHCRIMIRKSRFSDENEAKKKKKKVLFSTSAKKSFGNVGLKWECRGTAKWPNAFYMEENILTTVYGLFACWDHRGLKVTFKRTNCRLLDLRGLQVTFKSTKLPSAMHGCCADRSLTVTIDTWSCKSLETENPKINVLYWMVSLLLSVYMLLSNCFYQCHLFTHPRNYETELFLSDIKSGR